MYPQQELTRLAAYKAALQRDIALRRAETAEAAERVTHPLQWADRAVALWKKFTPLLAAVPIGAILSPLLFRRQKTLGLVARWGPLLFSTARGLFSAAAKKRPPSHD